MLKMRTALEEIAAICDGADTGGLDERTAIYNIAKAALSEPMMENRSADSNPLSSLQRIHQLSINLRRFLPSRRWRWMSKRDREELLRGLIWIGVECRTALSERRGDNEKSVEVD